MTTNTNTNDLPLPAFFRITTADGQWIHYYPRAIFRGDVVVERTGRSGRGRRVYLASAEYLRLLASASYVEK